MKKLYKCWFSNEDFNEENLFETKTFWIEDAVEEFLKFVYDNNDGWEWMPKDYGASIVIVWNVSDDIKTEFNWEIEYEPSFYITEKSE